MIEFYGKYVNIEEAHDNIDSEYLKKKVNYDGFDQPKSGFSDSKFDFSFH